MYLQHMFRIPRCKEHLWQLCAFCYGLRCSIIVTINRPDTVFLLMYSYVFLPSLCFKDIFLENKNSNGTKSQKISIH